MNNAENVENEIKSWLKTVLSQEVLEDFTVEILGNAEKGDGYVGDIVFARVMAITTAGLQKEYNLVLKCSKRSQALRETSPVKEAFENEIFFYDVILPSFIQFQLEKGISDPFDSAPKCYGTLIRDKMEVIVLEDLKNVGYTQWDKKKPLTRKHIEMVFEEYAKWHATSMVMDIENPKKIEEFDKAIYPVFYESIKSIDADLFYGQLIDEIADALKNDLDESLLLKWRNFKQQISFIFTNLYSNCEGKKVITHGDCWSNNFLFKHTADGTYRPVKVAVLDWQIPKYTSPIFDLSYHLFTTISEHDIEDLESILRYYHSSLNDYLKRFGYDVNLIYPIKQFFEEWKKFCRYGLLLACMVIKAASTEKQDVMDLAQAAEDGGSFEHAFLNKLKDTTVLRNRMRGVVKYVVNKGLI